jgi:hypothetical protein
MLASSLAEAAHANRCGRRKHPRGDGGNRARLTGEITKETVKTIRAGKAVLSRLNLWSSRVHFLAHGPWVPAGARPSLRLCLQQARDDGETSGVMRRENKGACPAARWMYKDSETLAAVSIIASAAT